MTTPKLPVESYTYFWLHTNTSLDPEGDPTGHIVPTRTAWGKIPANNIWNDGDHYVGRIVHHTIADSSITVHLKPMVRLQSNTEIGLKWSPIKRFDEYRTVFEGFVQVGKTGLPRLRFKSIITSAHGNDVLILSRDTLDEKIIEALIAEAS